MIITSCVQGVTAADNYQYLTQWGTYGVGDGQFDDPRGIAVDGSGNIYVAEYGNERIQKFSTTGTFLAGWADTGTAGGGTFNHPDDVAIDSSGNIYVLDTGNNRVQKFDANGTFVTKWGTSGKGDGQFSGPLGIAADALGNIYVADSVNDRIQKFTADGTFVKKWGTYGSSAGQFNFPSGVAVDSAGNVYVTEMHNHRVQKFTAEGIYVRMWGGYPGADDGRFNWPLGVAVDTDGNVYVADSNNNRVQKFAANGDFVTKWGTLGSGDGQFQSPAGIAVDISGNVYVEDTHNRVQKFAADGTYITQWGTLGSGDGQFQSPAGIATDLSGNVYVADSENNRVQKFATDGTFVSKWGSYADFGDSQFSYPSGVAVDSAGTVYVADSGNNRVLKFAADGTYITQIGTYGTGDGQINYPSGVAVDGAGTVYVADSGNNRVLKFAADGTYITQWGTEGSGDGQLDLPGGIAVDASGTVYVADSRNNRVQKFAADGTFVTQWGTLGLADGQFDWPTGIAVDGAGTVYVADTYNHRVQKFTADGTYITQWGTIGPADGQFDLPGGIAVDGSCNVYVADTNNYRVQKFEPAPPVVSTVPGDGESGVSTTSDITITYDILIAPGSPFDSIALAVSPGGAPVPIDVTVSQEDLVIHPKEGLSKNTSYSVTIPSAAVQSALNDTPFGAYSFSFVTGFTDIVEFSDILNYTETNVTETIATRFGSLTGGTVIGDLSGTISFPEVRTLTVATGAFAGQGQINGSWTATLGGRPCSGTWEGTLAPDNGTLEIRGAILGPNERGIFGGSLTETVAGSGVYDRYNTTWELDRIAGTGAYASINVAGSITCGNSGSYPGTQLRLSQELVSGTLSGDYGDPITAMVTIVRVMDTDNPCDGSGFAHLSYTSGKGQGEGHASVSATSAYEVHLSGSFSSPFTGHATGTYSDQRYPPTFGFWIEDLYKTEPAKTDLKLEILGPGRVSPGQLFGYVVRVSNEGTKGAVDVSVRCELPSDVDIVSVGEGERFGGAGSQGAVWNIESLGPGMSRDLTATVRAHWGLESNAILRTHASAKWKDQLVNIYYPGINWNEKDQNSVAYRRANAHVLNAILRPSYLNTAALSGAVNVYLAYRNIPTPENFLDTEWGTRGDIAFSHSGGTQTLFKKIKYEEIKVDYAVFAAPALLSQAELQSLIDTGKVKKILIYTSPQDVLYRLKLVIQKDYPVLGPVIYALDAPIISSLACGIPIPLAPLLLYNGISLDVLNGLPNEDVFRIGGNEGQDADFASIGNIVVKRIDDPNYIGQGGLGANEMHERLNALMVADYRNGEIYDIFGIEPQETETEGSTTVDDSDQKDDFDTHVATAHDPNIKYGPTGRVAAGQTLDYRVEFENLGEGTAYGVYFTDVLDDDLDASTLSIGSVFSTADGHLVAGAGIYDADTRTITWPVGEVGPRQGGYANISVKIHSDAPDDTEIINSGTVYFPSVPEITPTNALIAVVGYNPPPEIEWIPGFMVNASETIEARINATDPLGDPLSFRATYQNGTALPPGAALDPGTGSFLWTPSSADVGFHPLTFTVKDLKKEYKHNVSIYVMEPEANETPASPVANFSANRTTGTPPLPVAFTDLSENEPTRWEWDFGDGQWFNTSSPAERNPTHIYTAAGTYTVRLGVGNSAGSDTETKEDYIVVGATMLPFPGLDQWPQDLNGDGVYEDINGNGRTDFADIIIYFTNMDWIIANEPLSAFDCNGNGAIDFADVIWLFNNLDAVPVTPTVIQTTSPTVTLTTIPTTLPTTTKTTRRIPTRY